MSKPSTSVTCPQCGYSDLTYSPLAKFKWECLNCGEEWNEVAVSGNPIATVGNGFLAGMTQLFARDLCVYIQQNFDRIIQENRI